MDTILIIDDDQKLNRLVKKFLSELGFGVITATHPKEGLGKLRSQAPDLIILDVMLPEMNGFDLCRRIRQDYVTPIIMLTARGEVTDKIVGLEIGADDYLAKPFEPRELAARIKSVLRRARSQSAPANVVCGPLKIDFAKRAAYLDHQDIGLTTNEFAVLALMVRQPGKVIDRDEILQTLRGMDWEAFNRSVDITVSRLRHKLKDAPKNPSFIRTVRGAGYVFIGDCRSDASSSHT